MPGVVAGEDAGTPAAGDVHEKHQDAGDHHQRAGAGDRVERSPAELRRIRVDAARHPAQPEDVHRKKHDVEADEQQPEAPCRQTLVGHAARDGRIRRLGPLDLEVRFEGADDWLKNHREQELANRRDQFNQFLQERKIAPGRANSISESERNRLFEEFVRWSRAR